MLVWSYDLGFTKQKTRISEFNYTRINTNWTMIFKYHLVSILQQKTTWHYPSSRKTISRSDYCLYKCFFFFTIVDIQESPVTLEDNKAIDIWLYKNLSDNNSCATETRQTCISSVQDVFYSKTLDEWSHPAFINPEAGIPCFWNHSGIWNLS